jgi:phosphoglucosamine mutase
MKKYFGTDGIRGVAGTPPLNEPTLSAIGLALGRFILESGQTGKILIGRDTRESGPWISRILASALATSGACEIQDAGIISTPGLAFLVRRHSFVIGLMISASHNPFQDNGIKVFSSDGFKLPDLVEKQIETNIEKILEEGGTCLQAGEVKDAQPLANDYLQFLEEQIQVRLEGSRIGLDVCHGAAFKLAPEIFRRLGADISVFNHAPNGRNINQQCGSLHLECLTEQVTRNHLDYGVAFDGDADRALFVTGSGKIFDGDFVLLSFSRQWKKTGRLTCGKVIGTLMTNFALEQALLQDGLELIRAGVGDKYVLEEMKQQGANLGGEPSGHIILSDFHTTGDGILTALKIAELVANQKTTLDALAADFHPYPQILDGVKIKHKVPLHKSPELRKIIAHAEKQLEGKGRLVVRYSGTEPLLRIMAEGENYETVQNVVRELKEEISKQLA